MPDVVLQDSRLLTNDVCTRSRWLATEGTSRRFDIGHISLSRCRPRPRTGDDGDRASKCAPLTTWFRRAQLRADTYLGSIENLTFRSAEMGPVAAAYVSFPVCFGGMLCSARLRTGRQSVGKDRNMTRRQETFCHPLCVPVWLALCAAGCVMANESNEQEALRDESRLEVKEQSLYGNFNLYWPNAGTGRTDINVCWENPNGVPGTTAQQRATWRDARRAAVEQAWARFGRINFYGWDGNDPVNNPRVCTSGEAGLHVYVCLAGDALCPGLPASQANNPSTGISGFPGLNGTNRGIRMNRDHGLQTIVHEFGHALGFYHEEEIPNGPPAGATGNCAQQSFPNASPARYGAYDPNGTMAYCAPPTAAPWVSPNDIAGIHRSYGRRIPGQIVSTRGNCAAAVTANGNGATAFLWDCDEAGNDQEFWDSPSDGNGKYLYTNGNSGQQCLGAPSATSGATVAVRACSASEDWAFRNTAVRGFGGLCLDLQGGNTTNGTLIQARTCGALTSQRWSVDGDGHLRYGETNKCAAVRFDGVLVIWTCGIQTNQYFTGDAGIIQGAFTGNCLAVQGPTDAQYTSGVGLPTNGASVNEVPCTNALTQRWFLSGPIRYAANTNLCLDRGAGDANGVNLRLLTCNSTDAQSWDYYF